MERFSQFRDRGKSSTPEEGLLLIETRLWDRTLSADTYGTCRLSPALPHLSLHDPGAPAVDRRPDLLSCSTMASYRCTWKEGGFVVDIGSPRNMVD
jgi:hypothetical protein